jgi:hypothetical protein
MISSKATTNLTLHPRLPIAALLTVAAVIGVETFLHLNRFRLVDGVQANLMAKSAQIRDSASPVDDVAIFGDSKMFSVVPAEIAKTVGSGDSVTTSNRLRVTNYSWPFFGVEAYELMLNTYLRYRQPPKAILINGRPELVGAPASRNSLMDNPAHHQRAFVAIPLPEIMSFALKERQPRLLWHRLSWAIMPTSAVYRGEAFEALKDLCRGRGWPKPSNDYLRMTAAFRESGAFLMHQNRVVTAAEVEALEQVEGPYGLYHNAAQVRSFKRFLARTAEHNIQVLVIGSPAPPPYHERFLRLGVHDAYHANLTLWQQKYPNLRMVEPLYPTQSLHHFGDPGHLNAEGNAYFQTTYPALLASHDFGITTAR